jgi:hypothetical protein
MEAFLEARRSFRTVSALKKEAAAHVCSCNRCGHAFPRRRRKNLLTLSKAFLDLVKYAEMLLLQR